MVKRCDPILPARRPQSAGGRVIPGHPNEAKAAGKTVPESTKARQDLDLEKESVVFVGVEADSVKAEPIGASRVGNALAQEGRCMAGKLKIPRQVVREVYRGTVGQAE